MADERQKKQAAKAFEKEKFSKDKEVTGAKHTENRQDNIFSTENQFHANEKPVSNLPRDANRGNDIKNVISGHNVQKSEAGVERKTGNKKKYYRQLQQQQDTSGHNVQKSEADAEKAFLKENSFMQEEQSEDFDTVSDSTMENKVHVRDTYQRSEEKGKYHKKRVQRENAHKERAKSEKPGQSDSGDFQTKDDTFTQGQTEEFTDKKVQKAFDKSEKSRQKLQKAKDKMPKKRQYEMKRVFDEQNGKAKYIVVPVDVEKPFKQDGLGKAAVHKLQTENMYFVHRKIAETEKDNSAVEGAHKTEQRAEDIYHYMKYHRKSKAQRKRDRLERLQKKQVTADMKLEYEKFISENPHLKGNSPKKQLQRQLQKQRIKREYAKARRAGAEVKTAKETFTKTANVATGIAKKLQEIATKNKTLIITVGIFALLFIMIMSALSSCGSMFTGTVTTTMASTYLSLPAEIDAVDLSFTEMEMELQNKIDRIETDYPGYDEYDYNLGAIGHDPYTLISYLSAVHTEFTAAGMESEIQELFDAMYSLTTEEVEETRTRTVTKTGTRIVTNPDGTTHTEEYEYEEEEEYTVTILRVTLTVKPLESIVAGRMDSEQTEIFGAYTETKGGLQVFASPVDYYYISSYYGYRKNPNTGDEELHRGVDIAVPTGTMVHAAHDGTVMQAAYDSYYGNYVVITDSKEYITKYAHMDSLTVSAGQSVKKGDTVGKSGNTGSSTGSHLHIECLYNGEYYNPLFYFEAGTQTIYGETPGGTGGGTGNVIAPDSYDDAIVQALMTEANKYLGMPYTFGGTPPSSFDCSAFVCWVFSNSGVHNLPRRTTAQGIYDQCTPVSAADAKAGDIIFFTGTYNAGRPVTHVGIYCGNGTMVHCGDPIQYTSINTSYWQSHFYGFGRLN
ncbi:CD1108 family mobile element protein [Roseburia intestinalis]|jgi:murein DD-endopeptidase MepM/ murein hydrolase activator NlpD|uniref:CD1108 family mobile element protein n=1 Tax=Roseburia intestinalis TaxID=166486 RepID=UPI0022E48096|nr:peptidoglycan DD-metalloendopeptidase family protein [Roseburia intestinalis]